MWSSLGIRAQHYYAWAATVSATGTAAAANKVGEGGGAFLADKMTIVTSGKVASEQPFAIRVAEFEMESPMSPPYGAARMPSFRVARSSSARGRAASFTFAKS
jgi:hypothetical protein